MDWQRARQTYGTAASVPAPPDWETVISSRLFGSSTLSALPSPPICPQDTWPGPLLFFSFLIVMYTYRIVFALHYRLQTIWNLEFIFCKLYLFYFIYQFYFILKCTTGQRQTKCGSLTGVKSQSQSQLYCMALQWWNELTADVRTAESLNRFSKRLEIHLFRVHLDSA